MSSYPVGLRSVFKAAPSILMVLGTSTLFYLFQYAAIHHVHDHLPKPSYKSTTFELYIRQKDDVDRLNFQQMLNYNPNVKL